MQTVTIEIKTRITYEIEDNEDPNDCIESAMEQVNELRSRDFNFSVVEEDE